MFELTADANGFFSIPDLLFDGVAGLPSLELPWLPSSQAVNLDPDPTGLLDDAALLLPSAQSTPQQSEVPMVAASPAVLLILILHSFPHCHTNEVGLVFGGGV